jgi:catechol 2,3-dioxygenase-like lactoylglutathione lyase family enzyme
MSSAPEFKAVFPIGDTDPQDMPVTDVDQAVRYYEQRMGFRLQSRAEAPVRSAVMTRGQVTLRFAENGGDAEQASCYLSVSDVDLAREELTGRGAEVSPIRTDQHDGKAYRVFFVRDDQGLCYCIGAPA